jgi:hypothetical protein
MSETIEIPISDFETYNSYGQALYEITAACDVFINDGHTTPIETLTKVIKILENQYLHTSIDNSYK